MAVIHQERHFAITAGGALVTSKGGMLNPAAYANPQPSDLETMGDIAMWGTDNLLPQKMVKDIEATGILSAGIDAKTRIALGKGPMPAKVTGTTQDGYEILEFITNNTEINDFLEDNNVFLYSYATGKDLFGMGNPFTQLLLNNDRSKVLGFKRDDPSLCRFEKINESSGRIENVHLSGDWSMYTHTADKSSRHVDIVPLLDRDFPLLDLQSRRKSSRFMISLQYPLTGRTYYAYAPWYTASRWVKIAQGVPAMKEAMFNNQMTIKYLVEIHPEYWELMTPGFKGYDEKKQQEIVDAFYANVDQYLAGSENQYKSIFSTTVTDRVSGKQEPAIKITAIDDKIKDGKLLPDSAAANIEILAALTINAALMGVDMPGGGAYSGGAGSGSNIREAYLVQVMMGEVERRIISRVLRLVQKMNGWPSDIVWRFPNQILTTLNTGKNTQATS